MDKRIKSSIFKQSIKHVVFVSIALLALLPLLALTRAGLLLLQRTDGAGVEIATLLVFCTFSLATGTWLLLRLIRQLQRIADCGREIHCATADSARLNWISSSLAEDTCSETLIPEYQEPVQSRNELESLTTALGRLHKDISINLDRMKDQAFFLENLEIVLENCRDMVLIISGDQKVAFSNRVAKCELGILPEREVRHALAEGLLSSADYERTAQLFESWEEHDEEIEVTRIDGTSLTLHFTSTISRKEEPGRGLTKILVLRDITDKKRLEGQLYHSEKLASLGQLISGVAHELNNPLAAILGFAELCRGTTERTEIARNLEIIDREARRTAHIVENLLSFSRQRTSQRVLIEVQELAERCFNLMAYKFRTNNIKLTRDYDASLPLLNLDEYQMQQVFMNIVLNAVQAMEAAETGNPELSVTIRKTADQRYTQIEFRDNGPGIAPSELERIFEPFFTTKKADQGTGLGLPVSLNIVKNHGGTLVADSEQGEWTCFRILLPLAESQFTRKPTRRVPTVRKVLSGKILIVDDEPSVLAMTKQILERTGLSVVTADSLKAGRHALDHHQFDLVLVDIHMPDGSGTEVWKYVDAKQPHLSDKVIFMTGDPRVRRQIESTLGIQPLLLLKPFHVTDLQKAVDFHLGERDYADLQSS